MNILLNYADKKYRPTQKWCSLTGKLFGKFDKIYQFGPQDLDPEFRKSHQHILSVPRGNGCWLWKSYLLKKVVDECQDGDFVFYFDSGLFFIHDPRILLNYISDESPIFVTDIPLIESCFTKPECFDIMDAHEFERTNQIQSGYIVFKVNSYTRSFFNEYFEYSHTTDMLLPAGTRVDQLEKYYGYDFVTHREDQSILSLLCKKHGIKAHRDLSQRGFDPKCFYNEHYAYQETNHDDDLYPTIVYLHKCPNAFVFLRNRLYTFLRLGLIRSKILKHISK